MKAAAIRRLLLAVAVLARAVAASSAVPVVFSPVTLRNYSGITDNIGLRGLLDRLTTEGGPTGLARAMELGRLRKAVIIVVNAETAPDHALDRQEEVPTVAQVIRAIRDIPINRYSFETTELPRASFEGWAGKMRQCAPGGFDYYLIEVSFDTIVDPAERGLFHAIPTTYDLPAETVDRLRQFARRSLNESADYGRLLRGMQLH